MDDFFETALTVVEDATKGYVIDQALDPVLRPAFSLFRALIWHQWEPAVNECQLNLAEAVEQRRAKDREFVSRLQGSLRRGEAGALVTELVQAAARATTEERMKMLAAAAAGVLTPDLDSEMRSRVARTVEQLEPSDVLTLRGAAQVIDGGGGLEQLPGYPEARFALLQAGCVVVAEGVGYRNKFELTPVGRGVLRVLEMWPRRPEIDPDKPTV